jgi:hypothetical protein
MPEAQDVQCMRVCISSQLLVRAIALSWCIIVIGIGPKLLALSGCFQRVAGEEASPDVARERRRGTQNSMSRHQSIIRLPSGIVSMYVLGSLGVSMVDVFISNII